MAGSSLGNDMKKTALVKPTALSNEVVPGGEGRDVSSCCWRGSAEVCQYSHPQIKWSHLAFFLILTIKCWYLHGVSECGQQRHLACRKKQGEEAAPGSGWTRGIHVWFEPAPPVMVNPERQVGLRVL